MDSCHPGIFNLAFTLIYSRPISIISVHPGSGKSSLQILNNIADIMKKAEFGDIHKRKHFLSKDTVPEMISIQGMSSLTWTPSSEHNIGAFHLFLDYNAALSSFASMHSPSPFILIITAN